MLALSSHLNSWLETVDFFANSCMSCTRFYAPHIFVIVNWRLRDCSLVVIVEEIHTEPVTKENEMRTITIERHQKQRWRQQQHWKLNNYDGFSSCNGIFNALWRVFRSTLKNSVYTRNHSEYSFNVSAGLVCLCVCIIFDVLERVAFPLWKSSEYFRNIHNEVYRSKWTLFAHTEIIAAPSSCWNWVVWFRSRKYDTN